MVLCQKEKHFQHADGAEKVSPSMIKICPQGGNCLFGSGNEKFAEKDKLCPLCIQWYAYINVDVVLFGVGGGSLDKRFKSYMFGCHWVAILA